MSLHLKDEDIKNYYQHNLSGQHLLKADLHLTECEKCSDRLKELSAVSANASAHDLQQELSDTAKLEEDHVSYEQLELLVDNKLDSVALEIVQSHLEVCGHCRKEADDLRNFRESFNQPTQTKGKVISWRQRGAVGLLLRIASVAAMIVLFVWAATLPMRDRIKQLQAELERAKTETTRLTIQNSELLRQSKQLQTEIAQLKAQTQVPIIASLMDGGKVISLDQKGKISGLSSTSPLFAKITKAALTNQSIETPAFLSKLIGKQGSLLGSAKNGYPFELIGPVGTVVLEDQPNFQWKPLNGAVEYNVRVYDRDFKEVASSAMLKDTNWTPSKPFPRGVIFSWVVSAFLPDKEISSPVPPAPEAKFMVLNSDQYQKLQQAKQDLAQSHLVSGLMYAQFGLLDDSTREFQQLVEENPNSQIAKKLLGHIRSLRK